MSQYQTYYFRSPDKQTFLSDLKASLQEAGVDPYEEKAIIETEDSERLGQGIDVVEKSRWYETEPTYADDGTVEDKGVKGEYALINVRTNEGLFQSYCESFTAFDPKVQPSQIDDAEKVGGGSHRVEAPATPVRRFATT